ncbi:MAG: hypothetical protein M0Z47_08545 [Actinomycetota bacterium]|nr:hypothetical protein [Actinomycetota bacterium]
MHTFRDFRALRVDTEVVGTVERLRAGNFPQRDLVEDEESGFYLYEMARWSDDGRPLRVVGVIGLLSLQAGWPSLAEDARRVRGGISRTPPNHGTEGDELLWAVADTDIVDQVNPYRIGPIARIADSGGVAHRIYALVQPVAVELVRKAVEASALALLGTGQAQPSRSTTPESLCFFCQAKDLAHLAGPFRILYRGPSVARAIGNLPATRAALAEPPEATHLVISGGNRRFFVPAGRSVLKALTEVESHFGSLPDVEVEFTTASGLIGSEVASQDLVTVACPTVPVEEITAAALAGDTIHPASVGLSPRPLPGLILGEAAGQD